MVWAAAAPAVAAKTKPAHGKKVVPLPTADLPNKPLERGRKRSERRKGMVRYEKSNRGCLVSARFHAGGRT